MRILDASVGAPGACGDSHVWEDTSTFKALVEPDAEGWRGGWIPPGHYIAGDNAYRLRPFQMRPFKEPELSKTSTETRYAQDAFNKYIRRTRRIVERVFGVLKKRFLILIAPKEDSHARRKQDVWAACIVHNILVDYNFPVQDSPVYADGGRMLELAKKQLQEAVAKHGGEWDGKIDGEDDDEGGREAGGADDNNQDDEEDNEDDLAQGGGAIGAGIVARNALVDDLKKRRQRQLRQRQRRA